MHYEIFIFAKIQEESLPLAYMDIKSVAYQYASNRKKILALTISFRIFSWMIYSKTSIAVTCIAAILIKRLTVRYVSFYCTVDSNIIQFLIDIQVDEKTYS